MYTILVLLLATICGSNALQAGDCAKTSAIETLDLNQLEGKWYQFSSFGNPFRSRLERCYVSTITTGSDGKSFVLSTDRIVRLFNTHVKANWTVQANDQLNGNLLLKFKLPFLGTMAIPFKIIGTDDYKNYVILHACYSFTSLFKSNLGFIFTRKRHYKAKELESLYSSIDEALKKNGLSRDQFILSNQSDCDDEPAPPSNTDSGDNSQAAESSSTSESSSTPESSPASESSSASKLSSASESSPTSESAAPAEPSDAENKVVPDNEQTASGTQDSETTEAEKVTQSEKPAAA